MNNRIMPKWSEVKDCNGINLHLFDAVQVITSGNKRNNQTGRIIALLKTKPLAFRTLHTQWPARPYLQMVEVLFQDEKRSNFCTSSLRLVESSEEEKGKSLAKIDSLKLMGAEITDSDFCVDRYNNDAFLFDDETKTWNVMLEDISDVDRLFGTFFETEQNDSYCNIYADVDKYCTKLAKPHLTVSLWFGDVCVEAVRPLSKDEQEAVLRIIRSAYEKSDCKKLLKEWDAEEQKYVNSIMLEDGDGCYEYKFAADTIEAAKAGFNEVIWMAIELEQFRPGQDFSVNSIIEDSDGKYVDSDTEGRIVINRVVTTQEPSKYINWERAGTLPFIYTVDREKSEWSFHLT